MTTRDASDTFRSGLSAYNAQQYEAALALFSRAEKTPQFKALCIRNQGLCLYKLQKHDEARLMLAKAQKLIPDDVTLLEALGIASVLSGAVESGIDPLVKCIRLSKEDPSRPIQALVLASQQKVAREIITARLQEALQQCQDNPHLYISLAKIFSEGQQRQEAINLLQSFPRYQDNFDILHALGLIEKSHHRFQQCEKHWFAALALGERQGKLKQCETLLKEMMHLHAHVGFPAVIRQISHNLLRSFPTDENRISCLTAFLEKAMHDEARQIILQIDDKARYANDIRMAESRIARDGHDLPTALVAAVKMLQEKPDDAFVTCSYGLLLSDAGQHELAASAYQRALHLQPGYHMARWNLAIANFLIGNYREAFENAEARWKLEHLIGKRPEEAKELQRGEQISGKKIYVYPEQGLGDTIQFCRFALTLQQLGADVILRVQPPLLTLIANSLKGVTVISADDTLPAVDRQIALLSIPYILHCDENTIPAPVAYLQPTRQSNKSDWKKLLPRSKQIRVGIAWSGSRSHKNDRNRSIAFDSLKPLWELPVQYVAVQKDIRQEERDAAPDNLLILDDYMQDFNDTAMLMSHLDLIISVDSSPVHLAAATGRPVWLLLPRPCDWRWHAKSTASVWYPSMRIYRQSLDRTWAGVIEEIKDALTEKFSLGKSTI